MTTHRCTTILGSAVIAALLLGSGPARGDGIAEWSGGGREAEQKVERRPPQFRAFSHGMPKKLTARGTRTARMVIVAKGLTKGAKLHISRQRRPKAKTERDPADYSEIKAKKSPDALHALRAMMLERVEFTDPVTVEIAEASPEGDETYIELDNDAFGNLVFHPGTAMRIVTEYSDGTRDATVLEDGTTFEGQIVEVTGRAEHPVRRNNPVSGIDEVYWVSGRNLPTQRLSVDPREILVSVSHRWEKLEQEGLERKEAAIKAHEEQVAAIRAEIEDINAKIADPGGAGAGTDYDPNTNENAATYHQERQTRATELEQSIPTLEEEYARTIAEAEKQIVKGSLSRVTMIVPPEAAILGSELEHAGKTREKRDENDKPVAPRGVTTVKRDGFLGISDVIGEFGDTVIATVLERPAQADQADLLTNPAAAVEGQAEAGHRTTLHWRVPRPSDKGHVLTVDGLKFFRLVDYLVDEIQSTGGETAPVVLHQQQ